MGATAWLARAFAAVPEGVIARLAGKPTVIRGQRLDPWVQLITRMSASQTPMQRMTPAEARASNDRVVAFGRR